MKSGDDVFKSGWHEVCRIVGILALGAISLAGVIAIAHAYVEEFSDQAAKPQRFPGVAARYHRGSGRCANPRDFDIAITNGTDRRIALTKFRIATNKKNHSSVNRSSELSTDRIIEPNEVYRSCYSYPIYSLLNDYGLDTEVSIELTDVRYIS